MHGINNYDLMKNNIFNVGNEKLNYSKEDVCNAIKKVEGYIYLLKLGKIKIKEIITFLMKK